MLYQQYLISLCFWQFFCQASERGAKISVSIFAKNSASGLHQQSSQSDGNPLSTNPFNMFDTHVPDFRVEPFPIHARLNHRSEILFKNMDYLWVVYCEFEVNQYSNLLICSNDFSEIWPYWMYLMFHVWSRFNHPDHSPSPCCVPHWHKPRPEPWNDHHRHFEMMSWRY